MTSPFADHFKRLEGRLLGGGITKEGMTTVEQAPKRRNLDAATRAEIRSHVRARRNEDPGVTSGALHAEVQKKFGVEISSGNWAVTYWATTKPEKPAQPTRTVLEFEGEHIEMRTPAQEEREREVPPQQPAVHDSHIDGTIKGRAVRISIQIEAVVETGNCGSLIEGMGRVLQNTFDRDLFQPEISRTV